MLPDDTQTFADDVRQRGPLNWEWVQGILQAIGRVATSPGVDAGGAAGPR